MTTTISVITGTVETQLASLGALVGHAGWGMPVMDTYSLRSPGQHGDTWGGFALAPRIGSLSFRMKQYGLDAMYTLRTALLELFSPLRPSIILRFVTPEGTRQFYCHYYGGLEMDWAVGDWAAQAFTVMLKCNAASCYDPVGASWTFWASGGPDKYEVPTVVPYQIGAGVIDRSKTIVYPGSWGSFPTIRITGPITDPTIANETTGETLDFTGTTIAPGDWFAINCGAGLKTVVDSSGVNQISKLTAASDLSTFHLAAAPEVVDGVNVIAVTGTGIGEPTKVDLSYFVRYLGV
jgi:hypothetical protein